MTRVLVVGQIGQVATALAHGAWPAGWRPVYVERDETFDLTKAETVRAAVRLHQPALVLNAAAYTAVDKAETERDLAFGVNAEGPRALAAACREIGASLVHISTDYVFDGRKPAPYVEDDAVNPLSVYGASKEAGERAVREGTPDHVTLRTSWVYSPWGGNFVKTMLRLGAEREELGIVADQHGAPTSAIDIAAALLVAGQALLAGRPGVAGTYHFCGAGETTWHGFASAIFAEAARRGHKVPKAVKAIATSDYPTPAVRPANSRLDCSKLVRQLGIRPEPWERSLAVCLDQLLSA